MYLLMRTIALISMVSFSLNGMNHSDLLGQARVTQQLDHWEAAADSGHFEGLRKVLETWISTTEGLTPESLGRARFLRARLFSQVDSARAEYLSIALDGRSTFGAMAWLRLAQMDLAIGEAERAVSELERLRADYTSAGESATSWYWTARAIEQVGDFDRACRTYTIAIDELRAVDDLEGVQHALAAAQDCTEGEFRLSIQIGAFSRKEAAEDLEHTLDRNGYPARIFFESGLHKVRIGWFARLETARGLERRLREEGFSVAVVAAEL